MSEKDMLFVKQSLLKLRKKKSAIFFDKKYLHKGYVLANRANDLQKKAKRLQNAI